jgi:two-component system response regulator AtoC
MAEAILIVDDEEELCFFLTQALGEQGYDTIIAHSGREALAQADSSTPLSLVLLDLKLPDLDGLELLRAMKEREPDLPVIVLTAHGGVESAVQAMKLGAEDYLTKTFVLDELLLTISRVLETSVLRREVEHLRRRERQWYHRGTIVGRSPAMQEIFKIIDKVAAVGASSVLIQGESGTGKELVARAIHDSSDRAGRPFVALNCAAIPETLLESELFGHERGAFTDAKTRRQGCLELAHTGTLFLDEIGDMSLAMQIKLLRVLENKQVRRLGGTKDFQVDVWIIAATNQNLSLAMREGFFRPDLYYRLNVVTITVPPLRERREDIPLLIDLFVREGNETIKRRVTGVTREAMEQLNAYSWPGNVRELRNVIERAMILGSGPTIKPEHLPVELQSRPHSTPPHSPLSSHRRGDEGGLEFPLDGLSMDELISNWSKWLIEQALDRSQGNQSEAARLLHVDRETLRYRMRKHDLL